MDSYLSDHMVNLTPSQLVNLQNGVEAWTPKIRQINVNEHSANIEREDSANIVDRCESCHMGIREPVKLTAASMALKGKKQDEYARAFTSHPEPELLKIHDPEKFGCSPCHQGNGRATTSVEKAHGTYEHWLWPLFQEKRDNFKQAGDLMKQADKAESNEEANRMNDRAVALKVTNSKLDLRIVQLDRSTKSLLEDMKKVGPNLKDIRLKLNKNWIPVWLK